MRILPFFPLLCSTLLLGESTPEPLIQVGSPLPALFDLSALAPARYLPKDPRDPAQVEAARHAWDALIQDKKNLDALRLRLPASDPHRIPLLLAASQALKAQNPSVNLYLAFQEDAQPLWDENAWGALQGGILTQEDLGNSPEHWREQLMRGQKLLAGRPWYLWLSQEPGPEASVLLGDGGKLVVPPLGPASKLADSLPREFTEIEGSPCSLILRHPNSGERRHWRFEAGEWKEAIPPRTANEVTVEGKAAYDVGALLAKMRATQLRDRAAIRNSEATLEVDLHLQGMGSTGVDLGFTFTAFEEGSESEELVQREIRMNGVKANIKGNLQVPIVESRAGISIPVALSLTEHFQYSDGGPGEKPGCRRIRYTPLENSRLPAPATQKTQDPKNPTSKEKKEKPAGLPSGELLVEEATGRILEERSSRSDLPGVVKSEQRVLTYGEPAPGHWRLMNATTFERWVMYNGLYQVQRKLTYSQFRLNGSDFDANRQAARTSKAVMLKQTPEGVRYYNLKNGSRQVDDKPKTSGKGIGGVVLLDPALNPPVFPMGGLAYFDFNAFNKGIQINAVTAILYNQFSLAIPRLPLGLDLAWNISTMLYPITERPVRNGKLLDGEGVARQWGTTTLALGRDLGWGFNLQGKSTWTYNRFSKAREEKYQTSGFALPPSGLARDWRAILSWQRSGVTLSSNYGTSRRPSGGYGTPENPQEIPNQGRMESWGASASYHLRLAQAWWLQGEAGFTSGKGYDRFSSLGVGGFVKGIRSYSVAADRLYYQKIGVVLPSTPHYRLGFSLDHVRARSIDNRQTYGFTGVGVSGDLPGFWWFTTVRLDVGAGIQSDIPGVRGVNGLITFLRVF